jgi:hypothetical protein
VLEFVAPPKKKSRIKIYDWHIPGASSRAASLRGNKEELSASFNAQDQAPDDSQATDDSHVQDRQCASRIFDDYLRKGSQVLARFLTKQDIPHLFFQLGSQDCTQELINYINTPSFGDSRYEFQFCCLRTRFVRQGVVCFHSVGLVGPWIFTVITFNDSRGPDYQCAPWIFVDNLRKGRQVLARFLTKQDVPHLFFQLGSQDCTQELITCINAPYLGASRYEFQFCFLWTRFVSQGVVCFHSVGLVGSWTFTPYFVSYVLFASLSEAGLLFK